MRAALGTWAVVFTVAACAACASSPKPAGPDYPAAGSPPAGAQEALTLIREIEADPIREDEPFKARRAALLVWLIKAPDITVVLCADLLPDLHDQPPPHDYVLVNAVLMAQAAYLIEHPKTPPRDEVVYQHGLTGAIRTYRKLVAVHPEERRDAWDTLDAAERGNALMPYIRKALTECAKGGH
jgi:hypothetical protein